MRRLVVLPLALALLLPAPALAVRAKKKVHFLRAPRFEMPAFKSIGVVGVNGWFGEQMESAIVTALLDKERGLGWTEGLGPEDPILAWPNHFPVVERSRLDVVLGEKELGTSGLTSDMRTALAPLMEAGVLITGTMAAPVHQDIWDTESETEEVEVVKEETETSVEVDIEEDWWGDEEVTVTVKETTKETVSVEEIEVVTNWCLDRTVMLSFDMRAIDVATGRVLAAETVRASNSDYECSEIRENVLESIARVESLANDAVKTLAIRTANRVAPYWGTMKLVLERNKKTKDGVVMFTKGDDLTGAAAWMDAQSKADPYDDWLHYNAGLLLASTYRFDAAQEHLKAARAIKDRRIYVRLERLIRDLRADFDRLKAMGLPMRPLDLGGAGGGAAAATEEVVTVRGGKKRMSSIYSDGGGVGSVVAKVPGGMTLTVLAKRGKWIQVRTFDGKEGWISEDDLR